MYCDGFQGVVFPDGIIGHITESYLGSKHDCFMLNNSRLEEHMASFGFADYVLYDDSGYNLRANIISSYKGILTPAQAAFNKQMSTVRVTVEWSFGRVASMFRFLGSHNDLMIEKMNTSALYRVSVFLTNCKTCLDQRNQIADLFHIAPPSLEAYVASAFL